ncbi:MAG: hypothetical protein ACYC96_10515 [Fimbriimonadaceae bacterium]
MQALRNSGIRRHVAVIAVAGWALAALAGAHSSRIAMLIRFGRATKTLDVRSVSFDHTAVGRGRLHGRQTGTPHDITVVVPATAASHTLFAPNAKLVKVDLVLYVTDALGHQRLRSQVEIGNPVVAGYKLSADKKTATVVLSTKLAFVSEASLSQNSDWVAGG